MHKYLSCAISRLPVLEANTVARVSGHLPGLHPQHLWCWCSWSTVLGRVSEVIDRDVRPRFFSKTGGRRFEPCYSCQPNLLTLNHILGCRPGAVLRHRRIGLCQYPLHDIAGRRAGRRYAGVFDTNCWGYAVGVGLEYGFTPNSSAKPEYMHYGFDSVNSAIGSLALLQPVSLSLRTDTVKVGINYRWGGPIVAKY